MKEIYIVPLNIDKYFLRMMTVNFLPRTFPQE